MGTIRVGEVWLSVYPKDHEPPHTHAEIGSGEVVIDLLPGGNVALSTRKNAVRNATASEVRKALRAADTAYAQLMALWGKTLMAVLTTDEEIEAAIAAGKNEPNYALATSAAYIDDTDQIAVTFDNGIEVRFPRGSISELADKTPEQMNRVNVTHHGEGLRWEEFDIDYHIPNMMDGFAPSCRAATAASEFGRLGGSKKSPVKTAAVRANGKKGGRPRKVATHAKAS